jgi:hypothetical protein
LASQAKSNLAALTSTLIPSTLNISTSRRKDFFVPHPFLSGLRTREKTAHSLFLEQISSPSSDPRIFSCGPIPLYDPLSMRPNPRPSILSTAAVPLSRYAFRQTNTVDLMAQAAANSYRSGAHMKDDEIGRLDKHGNKTNSDQDATL